MRYTAFEISGSAAERIRCRGNPRLEDMMIMIIEGGNSIWITSD